MNKAFIREPELDGRAYCPRWGSLGTSVSKGTLDHHVRKHSRERMGDSAWFCDFAKCDVAYFDLFERSVTVNELITIVTPGTYPCWILDENFGRKRDLKGRTRKSNVLRKLVL